MPRYLSSLTANGAVAKSKKWHHNWQSVLPLVFLHLRLLHTATAIPSTLLQLFEPRFTLRVCTNRRYRCETLQAWC